MWDKWHAKKKKGEKRKMQYAKFGLGESTPLLNFGRNSIESNPKKLLKSTIGLVGPTIMLFTQVFSLYIISDAMIKSLTYCVN